MKLFNKNLSENLIVVAEIGVNHEGCLQTAKDMIKLVADSGADAVKFQSYTPERFVAANNPERLARVKGFALTKEMHLELYQVATSCGLKFMSTPVTEDWIETLNPLCEVFKIASGDLTFKPVLQKAAQTGKPILLSTGASTVEEIDQAVEWVQAEVGAKNLKDRLALMHCVSAYPTPIEEANLLSIPFLKDRYNLHIGYSNHVIGIEACLGAVALGAELIEVHFTDQKDGREFRDHALSFDENDLKSFITMAHKIKKALGAFGKTLQRCEQQSPIALLRKGIVAAHNLKAGDILQEKDLMFARPATEFKAIECETLIGQQLDEDVQQGFLIPRAAIKCVA